VILGVHSFFNSTSSEATSGNLGHSWISVENDKGEVNTYGMWPDGHDAIDTYGQQNGWNGSGTAIHENIEIMNGSHGHDLVSNYHWALTEEQAQTLMTCLNETQEYGLINNNCATWANSVCQQVTGDILCDKSIVTPSHIEQALDAKADALTQDAPTQNQGDTSQLSSSDSSSWGSGDSQSNDSGMGM
jgi:hypothetical protein